MIPMLRPAVDATQQVGPEAEAALSDLHRRAPRIVTIAE